MKNDIRWPNEVRGKSRGVAWLNRLLAACKAAAIYDIKVVGGAGKIQNNSAIISVPLPGDSVAGETIIPFTIYNIESNGGVAMNALGTGYAIGNVLTISGGTPNPIGGSIATLTVTSIGTGGTITGLAITTPGNYSVQPAYPNSPTGGGGSGASVTITDSSDDWRTFQMRDGVVSARPQHPQFYTGNTSVQPINGTVLLNVPAQALLVNPFGNFEWFLAVINDSQSGPDSTPTVRNETGIVMSPTEAQISGFDSGGKQLIFGQILMALDSRDTGAEYLGMSLWAEIIDDPVKGLYANLWGKMIRTDGAPGTICPTGSNIIPIGTVDYIDPTTPSYQQFQTGNLINRFPRAGGGYVKNYRGAWTGDALSGQLFYKGDEVVDDTATVGVPCATFGPDPVTIDAYLIWTYLGPTSDTGFNVEAVAPVAPKWIRTGWTPYIPSPIN